MTTYTQLKKNPWRGTWGLMGTDLQPGMQVIVTRRDGSTETETVGQIVHVYDDGTTIATKENVTTVQRRNGARSGAQNYRQRAATARAGYGRSGDAYEGGGNAWRDAEAEQAFFDATSRAELGSDYGQ